MVGGGGGRMGVAFSEHGVRPEWSHGRIEVEERMALWCAAWITSSDELQRFAMLACSSHLQLEGWLACKGILRPCFATAVCRIGPGWLRTAGDGARCRQC